MSAGETIQFTFSNPRSDGSVCVSIMYPDEPLMFGTHFCGECEYHSRPYVHDRCSHPELVKLAQSFVKFSSDTEPHVLADIDNHQTATCPVRGVLEPKMADDWLFEEDR